jgi:hypothetical protein
MGKRLIWRLENPEGFNWIERYEVMIRKFNQKLLKRTFGEKGVSDVVLTVLVPRASYGTFYIRDKNNRPNWSFVAGYATKREPSMRSWS